MTTQRESIVPEWTMGDRLRKARSLTGLGVREFAELIGVSHGTVTNAETDARAVRTITLNAWAAHTGVSREWLETGQGSAGPTPTPPEGPRGTDRLARLTESKRARVHNTRGRETNDGYLTAA